MRAHRWEDLGAAPYQWQVIAEQRPAGVPYPAFHAAALMADGKILRAFTCRRNPQTLRPARRSGQPRRLAHERNRVQLVEQRRHRHRTLDQQPRHRQYRN